MNMYSLDEEELAAVVFALELYVKLGGGAVEAAMVGMSLEEAPPMVVRARTRMMIVSHLIKRLRGELE